MVVMDIKRPKPKSVSNEPLKPVDNSLKKKLTLLITSRRKAAIVLATILVLFIGFITFRHIQAGQGSNNSQQHTAEVQKVIAETGKLVLLPSGQVPTVAIIKDASELRNQSFFANAQDGDYVLVYSQAKKAILYRPSINRVIAYSGTN